jgi:RNA polymerase sigma factor for flagellar operon FliA
MRLTKMISWEQTAQPNGFDIMDSDSTLAKQTDKSERLEVLTEALQALPEKERQIVVMYHLKDMRLREIADVVGLSQSRVSRIMDKAMFELREFIRSREERS